MDREWKELMDGVREECLSETQFARLEARLRTSPEDRTDYLRRAQLQGLLE